MSKDNDIVKAVKFWSNLYDRMKRAFDDTQKEANIKKVKKAIKDKIHDHYKSRQ